MLKILLILFLVGDAISVNKTMEEAFSFLAQMETATEYPKDVMDGDVSLVTDEDSTMNVAVVLGRQNEIDEDDDDDDAIEEEVNEEESHQPESTTVPLIEQGCTKPHEHYEQCGPRCQQSCAFQMRVTARKSRAICESVFSGNCHAGCFCDSGYVRFNDECILPIQCPTRICLGNEEFRRNGTPCQLTCDNYKFANEIEAKCPKDIPIAGCFCKPGYVRGYSGACILPNRCQPGRVN